MVQVRGRKEQVRHRKMEFVSVWHLAALKNGEKSRIARYNSAPLQQTALNSGYERSRKTAYKLEEPWF